MTTNGNLAVVLSILLSVWLAGCTSDKPGKSTPWVVVLDEAPTRNVAVRKAEQYLEKYPKLLEKTSVLSFSELAAIRHLVISEGFGSREKAMNLSASFAKVTPAKLKVIDTTSLKALGEDEAVGVSAPEDAEILEQLAILLPEPVEARLDSFLLMTSSDLSQRSALRPFGYGCPGKWWSGFSGLGWQAAAQAVYVSKNASDSGKVHVFLGWLGDQAADREQALKKVYNFLLDYVGPLEEEWEKKKKQRKRRRRLMRAKRRKKASAEEPVVLKEVPKASKHMLPWGGSEVVKVERVAFIKKESIRKDTPTRTALLSWTPGRQGVMLVMFDPQSEGLVEDLLNPRSLEGPHGIAFSPHLAVIWNTLPEVSVEDENLGYLGMQSLRWRMDNKRRRSELGKRLGDLPVYLAGYCKENRPYWQLIWVKLGSPVDAEKLYDSAYVEPRKEKIQHMLNSPRKPRYDVGITLREVGDVLAWHLRGAEFGALQELYFQKKDTVWLLQARDRGKTSMDPDGLQARTELLQIWDVSEENP